MRQSAAVALLLCTGACAKKMGPRDAAAPEAVAAPGGDLGMEDSYAAEAEGSAWGHTDEPQSFEELQARFEQLDADLSAQGISGTEEMPMTTESTNVPNAKSTPEKKDVESRCERICGLKDAICDVSDRICGLAGAHEEDVQYVEACARSESRCEQATTACTGCAE